MTKSVFLYVSLAIFLLCSCNVVYDPGDLFPETGQRKLLEIWKDGQTWQKFTYNVKDNLIRSVVYYSGQDSSLFLFSYDERDRLITREMPYQKDTLIYDETGRLTTMITSSPGSPRSETTHYTWSKGRITMGRVFLDGNLVNKIDFMYDSHGNTIRRKCQITDRTFDYDGKRKPMKDLVHLPLDIIQKNNPVKSYYSNSLMSSFPPNYEHQYEYDSEGYPIRETRTDTRTKLTTTLEYLYSE